MSTEQEYEEQADMLDRDDPSDQSAGPGGGPVPPPFPTQHSMQPPMPPVQNAPYASPNTMAPTESGHQTGAVYSGMPNLYDPYDPMLDADPFGLSASMHFPTMYESR